MSGGTHERIRELLSERLDRPLVPAEAAEIDGHLAGCAACRATDRDFTAQRDALRRLGAPEPPRDLWARTSAALDREVTRPRLPVLPRRRTSGPGRAAVGTGVAILVVALVIAMPLSPIGPAPSAEATPYAIAPDDLVLAAQSGTGGVSIGRTRVDEVCPASEADCTSEGTSENVASLGGFEGLDAFVVDPDGQLAVLSGVDDSGHVRYEIVVIDPPAEGAPSSATEQPTPSDGGAGTTPAPTAGSDTPTATASATRAPVSTTEPTATPPTPAPTDTGPPETATPAATPTASPTPTEEPTPSFAISPPPSPSAAPAGEPSAGAILTGVIAAGMPAAWSPDGSALAFSARPADGSRGPDIYIWRPGAATATPVTDDGVSYFASWAGNRVVGSRATPMGTGRLTNVDVESFVLDLSTGEQRTLQEPNAWLPVVDPTGRHAVSWRGRLAAMSGAIVPVSGRLFLESWREQDPFTPRDAAAGEETASPTSLPDATAAPPADGRPLGEEEGIGLASVREWEVRWAADGSAFGVWVADEPLESTGRLAVVAISERRGEPPMLDVVVGPEAAWRSFALGAERVAYVSPNDDGPGGELRVATWGPAGSGLIRIRQVMPGEALPAF